MNRFRFLSDLNKGILTPFQMFSWKRGGGRAGESVNIVWRIPRCVSERCENSAFTSQSACLASVTKYAGRVTRHVFLAHTDNPSFISSKAAAMSIYENVIGERLSRDASKAKDYAICIAELVLSTRDYDIVQDLRGLNGRSQSPLFDMFWSELKTLLESHVRVDDHRHGEHTLFTSTMRIPVLLSFVFPFRYPIRCR
jgi:hypothetical protein